MTPLLGVASWAALLTCGCAEDPPPPAPQFVPESPRFREVSAARGFAPVRELSSASREAAGPLAPLLELMGGIAVGDVDADGNDDLLILGADAGAQLFLAAESTREVDGHELLHIDYRDRAAEYQLELGEFSTGALFVDVDLDGDDDLLVPQLLSGAVQLWLNDDGAGFERDEEAAIDDDAFAPAIGLAAADVDLDGDVDLFVARWAVGHDDDATQGVLWINDGSGNFRDHSEALSGLDAGRRCERSLWGVLSPAFSDVFGVKTTDVDGQTLIAPNLDVYPELAIARFPGPNQLFVNLTSSADEPRFELVRLGEVDGIPPDGEPSDGTPDNPLVAANRRALAESAMSSQLVDVGGRTLPDWLLLGTGAWSQSCDGEDPRLEGTGGQPEDLADAGPLAPEAGAERRGDTDAGRGPLDAAAPASFDGGPPRAGGAPRYAPLTEFGAGRNVVLERDYESFPNEDDALTFTQVMRTKDSLLGPGSAPSRNACVADFNNDGLYDVFIVTGSSESYPPLGEVGVAATDAGQRTPNDRSLLYVGAPGGTYSEQAGAAGIADDGDGRWVTCFDYDRDGDVDVFVMNDNTGRLYENQLPTSEGNANFLSLRVEPTDNLPLPLGVSVQVSWLNQDGTAAQRTQQVSLNTGTGVQRSRTLHFGLGNATDVYRMTVSWPDGALETVFLDLGPNAMLRLRRTASY